MNIKNSKQRKSFFLSGNNCLKMFKLFAAMITITTSLTGCFLIPKQEEFLAPPLKEPPLVKYDFITAQKKKIERKVECKGNFVSTQQQDLSFKNLTGRLKAVYFNKGDKIKKGDLVAELSTEDIQNQINQQEILYKKSQYTLEKIKNEGNSEMELLTMKFSRLKKEMESYSKDSTKGTQMDSNELSEQIREQELLIKNASITLKDNIKIAESDLELTELQLAVLRRQYNESRLFSTIDGTVVYAINVPIGEQISSYKTILRIADPDQLLIQYSDDQVTYFGLGMEVNCKVNNDTFLGKVVATPSTMPLDADEKTRSSILIRLDDQSKSFTIGDFADITLTLEMKENVIVIPKGYLHDLGERKFVYVLENNLKKERDVEVGMDALSEIEITKGISEDEKLVRN